MPSTIRFQQLRLLRKHLRFARVPRLVGQHVHLDGPDQVYERIAQELGLQPLRGWWRDTRLGATAKYGLLDLAYDTAHSPGPLDAAAFRRLLAEDDEDVRAAVEEMGCVGMMVEDATTGPLRLLVMLDVVDDERSVQERFQHTREGLPAGFWPRRVRVRDACVTNAPWLWTMMHFYL